MADRVTVFDTWHLNKTPCLWDSVSSMSTSSGSTLTRSTTLEQAVSKVVKGFYKKINNTQSDFLLWSSKQNVTELNYDKLKT